MSRFHRMYTDVYSVLVALTVI